MKRIKYLLVLFVMFLMPIYVHAAGGSISVSGPANAVVGNNISVTVTISSSTKIGSWQMDLNYDKSYLQLTSSSAESGGVAMAGSSSTGVKSKSYTFKFKTLKSGSTNLSVSSYLAYAFDDMSQLSLSAGSKSIKIQTQAEIEASYSDDAFLKSLSVDGYSISPEFDKKVNTYSLEVENNVEKVNVKAVKSNANAKVSGSGEINLVEGNNKVDIVVTSQKGNQLTYTININRKELNPIEVKIGNSNYKLVRKADELPSYSGFTQTNVKYEDQDIIGLTSEVSNLTLIGVKDEEGNVSTYIYKDNKITDKYVELKAASISLMPLKIDEVKFKGLIKTTITIDGNEIDVLSYNDNKNYYILYAMNLSDGKSSYYIYDQKNNTYIEFDEDLFNELTKSDNTYMYAFCASLGVILLCIIIIIAQSKSRAKIIKRIREKEELLNSNKKKKNKEKEEEK